MARTVRGELPVGFRYTPGVGNTAFFEALRDRGVLLGSRCGSCSITYVPARIFCERCFDELAPDTECGPGGTIESFSNGYVDVDGKPTAEPVVAVLVRLDGADTVTFHRFLGNDEPRIGMRVTAKVRPASERTASIADVAGFEPA